MSNTHPIKDEAFVDAINNPTVFDITVIGGGVAGLTAGLYASRDGFKTLVLEGDVASSVDMPGGALMLTSEIANYPGFNSAEGAELIEVMREQAETFGAHIKEERASELEISDGPGKCHSIKSNSGTVYKSRAIIIATGAVARRLGIPGEDENYGTGVSSCATCDGFFFQDKVVAVVGGGDTAVEDALLLTHYATKVHLLVRGDNLRSTGPEAREIVDHPDVEVHWNTTAEEVFSEDSKVTGVKINTKGVESTLDIDGLFVAIGSDPATGFLDGSGVPVEADGYIAVNEASTAILGLEGRGIFAAGDVADRIYRQAITSAGKAAQAALEARAYLNSSRHKI